MKGMETLALAFWMSRSQFLYFNSARFYQVPKQVYRQVKTTTCQIVINLPFYIGREFIKQDEIKEVPQ